jgi:hypothetical protein
MNKTSIALMTTGIVEVLSVLTAGNFYQLNPCREIQTIKKVILKCYKYDTEHDAHDDSDYFLETDITAFIAT